MMKKELFKLAMLLSVLSLYSCSKVQYQTLYRQYDVHDEEQTWHKVYQHDKDNNNKAKLTENPTIQLDNYLFQLSAAPYSPKSLKKVVLILTAKKADSGKPALDLEVICHAIQQETIFINTCNKPHVKDTKGHYTTTVEYNAPGKWQVRFEVKTPDNKILKPIFYIVIE